MAEDNCSDVMANWNRVESPCGSVLFNVSLKSLGDDILRTVITSDTSHTFTITSLSTTDFTISVFAFNANVGESALVEVIAQIVSDSKL